MCRPPVVLIVGPGSCIAWRFAVTIWQRPTYLFPTSPSNVPLAEKRNMLGFSRGCPVVRVARRWREPMVCLTGLGCGLMLGRLHLDLAVGACDGAACGAGMPVVCRAFE
jgi:hypothetical protein